MESLAELATDAGVNPEETTWMVFLWKLGAGKTASTPPGECSREEFTTGMAAEGIKTLSGIKKQVPSCDVGFLLQEEFTSFYKFFFRFNLEGTHKTLEVN